MIKWPITYTDYNGDTQTEDFYFNLNKAELMEMNLKANGAYSEYLQRILDQRDGEKIAEVFRTLIQTSYGEKSPDGRRFVKNKDLTEAFVQTEAYSELYVQLATDADAATKFIEGVLPKVEQQPPVQDKPALV